MCGLVSLYIYFYFFPLFILRGIIHVLKLSRYIVERTFIVVNFRCNKECVEVACILYNNGKRLEY